MAIRSMTGFGRGEAEENGRGVTVELSAVNRKQFDCSLSLPRELSSLDTRIQTLIRTRVSRGYVKGVVTVATSVGEAGGNAAGWGPEVIGKHLTALRDLAKRLGLADDLTASSLLCLPDLLRGAAPLEPEKMWPLVERAGTLALKSLDTMRHREGAALEHDLRKRLTVLEKTAEQIAARAPMVPVTYQTLLTKRLGELLGEEGTAVDAALVAREVAVFADRCDVSEELTRLGSHFAQVVKTLDSGGTCGRTLDFLCQELFREINTTGSKANDAEISRHVIAFKAALEAMREQVQNIE